MINSTLQTPIESIRFFAHFKKVKMTKIRQDKQNNERKMRNSISKAKAERDNQRETELKQKKYK